MAECPAECQQRLGTIERDIKSLKDDIHNREDGALACLKRKVGWKQLGGVGVALIALLGIVVGTSYLAYSRSQDKQDYDIKIVEKTSKIIADKQTEQIIEQKVMNEKLNTVINAQEEQKDLTKRIWRAIRGIRDGMPPDRGSDE